jgi:hypothetical protein
MHGKNIPQGTAVPEVIKVNKTHPQKNIKTLM